MSYDHYGITIGTDAEIAAQARQRNVFPQEKMIAKPGFFSSLELLRNLPLATGLPFWAFTCSLRHGLYPTPTEGHIRFQLMNALAYGAKGAQYFTYAHCGTMVRADGSTTETWEIARRVNADIMALAGEMASLENIGVYRTGPLWSGTQHLPCGHAVLADVFRMPGVECEGDPVTVGFFQDRKEDMYLFVVTGNPCRWAKIRLMVDTLKENERLYGYDVKGRRYREISPADPHPQWVILALGEGRLFKVQEDTGAGEDLF